MHCVHAHSNVGAPTAEGHLQWPSAWIVPVCSFLPRGAFGRADN
jgi:hypothetical protein